MIPDEVDDSAALIGAATIANRVIGCVNAPSLVQKVIKYCIEHEVTVDLETYEKNRNLIYGALTEYGFTCAKPDGAFYLFVKSPVENEGILRGGEETSRAGSSGQFVCLSGVRETGLLCVL